MARMLMQAKQWIVEGKRLRRGTRARYIPVTPDTLVLRRDQRRLKVQAGRLRAMVHLLFLEA